MGHSGCQTVSQPDVQKTTDNRTERIKLLSSGNDRALVLDQKNLEAVDQAIKSVKRKLDASPRDFAANMNMSELLVVLGKYEQAEKFCRKALATNLRSKEPRKVMAEIAIRRGKFDLAKIILNGLGGADSKDSEVLNMMALINIEEKNLFLAKNLLLSAAAANPSDTAVRMNLGILYLRHYQPNAAIAELEKASKLSPDNDDIRLHLAIAKVMAGKLTEAGEIYEGLPQKGMNAPLVLYNRAVLELAGGKHDKAAEYLNAYVRKFQLDNGVDKAETQNLMAAIRDAKANEKRAQSATLAPQGTDSNSDRDSEKLRAH